MNNITIIGFAGKKRAGKNTAAEAVQLALAAMDAEIYVGTQAFAQPLYDMLETLLGHEIVNDDSKDTDIVEPYGVTLRHLLQTLGTEWGRELIHPDMWVLYLKQQMLKASARLPEGAHGVVLVPDVRMGNEAAFIREHGTLVHIERPVARVDGHKTENGLPVEPGDLTLLNNHLDLNGYKDAAHEFARKHLLPLIATNVHASAGDGQLLSGESTGDEPLGRRHG